MSVQLHLTRKQNKAVKKLQQEYPGIYRFLPTNVNFDYLPLGSDGFYPFSFRIVRFKISDNSTETLITNLDTDSFSVEELKQLYHLRWDIETSFRQLKYTMDEIIYPVCTLCRDQEKAGFIEGVKVGVRLYQELNE